MGKGGDEGLDAGVGVSRALNKLDTVGIPSELPTGGATIASIPSRAKKNEAIVGVAWGSIATSVLKVPGMQPASTNSKGNQAKKMSRLRISEPSLSLSFAIYRLHGPRCVGHQIVVLHAGGSLALASVAAQVV